MFPYLTFNNTNIELIKEAKAKKEFDMTELYENSKCLKDNPEVYPYIVDYMKGNCIINKKLSNYMYSNLNKSDFAVINAIKIALTNVKPLSQPVNLFHGFEAGSNYHQGRWRKGKNVKFDYPLSKTPSFDVALSFAKSYSYPSLFYPRFLFVKYPINSRHISLDLKREKEEYEYLNAFEKLEFEDTVYEISTTGLRKYYVMDAKQQEISSQDLD